MKMSWCFHCTSGLTFFIQFLTYQFVLARHSLKMVWWTNSWFFRQGFLSEIKFKVRICDRLRVTIFVGKWDWRGLWDSSWYTNQRDCGGWRRREIGFFQCFCGQFPWYWNFCWSFQFWNLINLSYLYLVGYFNLTTSLMFYLDENKR